jgi:hypothetical protein
MVKANQLLDELAEQKALLEIQNSDTMQNVQLLINMIRKYYVLKRFTRISKTLLQSILFQSKNMQRRKADGQRNVKFSNTQHMSPAFYRSVKLFMIKFWFVLCH